MTVFELFNHLFNFVLPALAVALVLVLGARILMKKGPGAPALWAQIAINFVVGALVLLAGLIVTGRDGRMASYIALVVVCATVQWGLIRGWRK